jgi:hypothetical protein
VLEDDTAPPNQESLHLMTEKRKRMRQSLHRAEGESKGAFGSLHMPQLRPYWMAADRLYLG